MTLERTTHQGWTGKLYFSRDGEGPGQGTYCVYQLIEIMCTCAAAKEILTCIALSEVNLLNIHNLDRNHN